MNSILGLLEGWRPPQLSWGEEQGTPWTGRQSITVLTQTDSRINNEDMFGLWEEAGGLAEKPRGHREKMQTQHRRSPNGRLSQTHVVHVITEKKKGPGISTLNIIFTPNITKPQYQANTLLCKSLEPFLTSLYFARKKRNRCNDFLRKCKCKWNI